jgi:HEAT repeat protein
MELRRRLMETLEEMEFDDESPQATAESYLNAAADRAGLLEEKGKDIFAFWHPTFEEFLAAVDLTTPTSKSITRLMPLRGNPRWREVILLAVGYIGVIQHDSDTATDVVAQLWNSHTGPMEALFHDNLLLAAACIADDVGVKRTLAQQIMVRLAEVVRVLPYQPFIDSFAETVRSLGRLNPSTEVLSALSHLITSPWWEVRMEVARLYSNAAATDVAAAKVCERFLGDSDPDVQCHAALGLARAGDYRPEVISALVHFRSRHAHVEATGRKFLSGAPVGVWESMRALLAVPAKPAGTASDAPVLGRFVDRRVEAAMSLAEFGRYDKEIIVTLLSLQIHDYDLNVTQFISRLGRENGAIRAICVDSLDHDALGVRLQAAAALLRMGGVELRAVTVLVSAAANKDRGISYQARGVLIERMREDGNFIGVVKSFLSDSDRKVRLAVAELLAPWEQTFVDVSSTLSSLLIDSGHDIQEATAASLYDLCRTSDQKLRRSYWYDDDYLGRPLYLDTSAVVGRSFWALDVDDSEDDFVGVVPVVERLRCTGEIRDALLSIVLANDSSSALNSAMALAVLGYTDESIFRTIIRSLDSSVDAVRLDSAILLIALDREVNYVIEVLISLCGSEGPIGSQAWATLIQLNQTKDGAVAERILPSLSNVGDGERVIRARLLAEMGCADQSVVLALSDSLQNADKNVGVEAALALVRIGQVGKGLAETLFRSLENGLIRYDVVRSLAGLSSHDREIAVRLMLILSRSGDRQRVFAIFDRLIEEISEDFFETAASLIVDFKNAEQAWRSFISCGELTCLEDVDRLTKLVLVSASDTALQSHVRRLLFSRLVKRRGGRELTEY